MPALLLHLFTHYGYLVIFVAVLLENAGIPAPGHTAILAGAITSTVLTLFVLPAICEVVLRRHALTYRREHLDDSAVSST